MKRIVWSLSMIPIPALTHISALRKRQAEDNRAVRAN